MTAQSPRSAKVSFGTVYAAMVNYAAATSNGMMCAAMYDFIRHAERQLGRSPKYMPSDAKVSAQFGTYWLAVAGGMSPDYDAATGSWIDADD
jgi:hypothetical protein